MKTIDELALLSRREKKAHFDELIRENEARRLAYLKEQQQLKSGISDGFAEHGITDNPR